MTEALKMEEMTLNLGPQHPSTHGVLRVILKLDGEVITSADPDMGYLHRGIEKLAEARDYTQIIVLTDRMDYVSSMLNNFAYCLAVEKLFGPQAKPPERAEYIRVLAAELQRIASHLLFFGTYGIDIGALTPFLYAFREREMILDLFEMVCGARLTVSYFRIGGVYNDLPPGFLEKTQDFCGWMKGRFQEYQDLLSDNVIFKDRTKNIGILNKEKAIAFGVSGPNLRASGFKYDIRKNEPYSVYDRLEFDVPVGVIGDCWDRYHVRFEEMKQSVKITEQCIEKLKTLPTGPGTCLARMPKILKPPAGDAYGHVESSRGDLGFYLVSDGTEIPHRMKTRRPSFVNLGILPELLKGWKVADVVAILGSIDIVLGEVDC